jgi:hypothetical protein
MENEVMFEIKIRAMKDGSINVSGPVQNFVLFRDIMNAAERAVLKKMQTQIQKEAQKRIIEPGMKDIHIVN